MKVLVTGASGYIGSRLVPILLKQGHSLKVLVRDKKSIKQRTWSSQVEIIEGDALAHDDIRRALENTDAAFYLLHSMDGRSNFKSKDSDMAKLFTKTASACGVKRIVYLGGVRPNDTYVSDHMKSRAEVGDIFIDSDVSAIVLQAAIIIGTGSASFEMVRYLTKRLPIMIAPKWLRNKVQPIAVEDVLYYLQQSIELPSDVNRAFDIGGPDIMRYDQLIQVFASVAGLRRRHIFTLPLFTPKLARRWIGLVTPVPKGLAKPLVESLIHEAVCKDHDVAKFIPDPPYGLTSARNAIEKALGRQYETGLLEPGDTHPANPTTANPTTANPTTANPTTADPDWVDTNRVDTDHSKTSLRSKIAKLIVSSTVVVGLLSILHRQRFNIFLWFVRKTARKP